jgi:Flp pilus assembly CpaE family ATPase
MSSWRRSGSYAIRLKKTLLVADEVVITAVPDLVSLRNAKNLVDL